MPISSQKRAHSLVRSDLSSSDQFNREIYQTSINLNNVFPSINPMAVSYTYQQVSTKANNSVTRPKLIQYIEENIIGHDTLFQGPWGVRRSESRKTLFSSSQFMLRVF